MRSIIVPVDGSPQSIQALRYAISLAIAFGDELVLLSVHSSSQILGKTCFRRRCRSPGKNPSLTGRKSGWAAIRRSRSTSRRTTPTCAASSWGCAEAAATAPRTKRWAASVRGCCSSRRVRSRLCRTGITRKQNRALDYQEPVNFTATLYNLSSFSRGSPRPSVLLVMKYR